MLSTARRPGGWGPAVLVIVVVAAIVAACGGMAGAPGASGGAVAGAPTAAPGLAGADGEQGNDGQGSGLPRTLAPADLLIIKTGTMTLQVTGLDAAINAANQQVAALGGFASASERSGDGESAYASITYRIPADRWDEALAGLRGLAQKVVDERAGTQDVTGQVIDLGARIKNLQATESALQAIMARATEIKDVLAVQAELTQVRGEIERLTAEKGGLEEQAALSTLTVVFTLKPDPVLTETQRFDPASEVDEASASLVGILQGLATAGIWFAIVWVPILVVLAILGLVGLAVWRRVRRRLDADAAAAAPTAGGGVA